MDDVLGQRFGRLVVTTQRGNKGTATCDCGTAVVEIRVHHLRSGHTKSCGCGVRQKTGPLDSKHPLYVTWCNMLHRCSNPNAERYADYGGRGIRVCLRWQEQPGGFRNFVQDMGERPPGKTLDRKDNDGNYEPSNCRWATATEQNNNSRHNRRSACDTTTS